MTTPEGRIRRPAEPQSQESFAGNLGAPPPTNQVLDTSPDVEPFDTEDARSSFGTLELMYGYIHTDGSGEQKILDQAVMKEMSGFEEDILMSAKMDTGKKFSFVLSACLQRIGDGSGTYITERDKLREVVEDLPLSDRNQMLVHLRTISVGDHFSFQADCPSCKENSPKSVDLSKLKRIPPPDRMERVYEMTLPGGVVARCKVLTGRDKEELDRAISDKSNRASLVIRAHVMSLNGKVPTVSDIKKLSLRQRNFLRNEFDRRQGEIVTEIPLECNSCGMQFDFDVDFVQKDFFFPSDTAQS